MSILKLIIRSIVYFRKQNLALLAGTLISTAVLTGALIIGDSVKYSLRKLVDLRLGNTNYALFAGNRFVRSDLAKEIAQDKNINAAPILMLQGIAINPEIKLRINKTQVIGINKEFQVLSFRFQVNNDEAIISQNLADKLNLKQGDEFLLRVENAELIPLNIPFKAENASNVALRLSVKAIANDEDGGRFSLKSNQSAPYNVFVSIDYLSEKLKLKGLANVILFTQSTVHSPQSAEINSRLKKSFSIEDAGLKIRELGEEGKYELLSDRVFIDEPIVKAINEINIPHESILTYLVNTFHCKGKEAPYSFVSAASSPLVSADLGKDEIIINDWLAKDLNASVRDTIKIDYFVLGPLHKLIERSKNFVVREIISLEKNKDRINESLMPLFPGLSDAVSCRSWNTGIPVDLKKIRDKDEQYWNKYRGTPKALISLESGLELWQNQFGSLTAIRFNKKDIAINDLRNRIADKIKPEDIGVNLIPIRDEALKSANSSVDFGELFLGLSFFIIASGILLTILIYTLNTERRTRETAILAGLGFSKKLIIKIRLTESAIVILLGAIAGVFAGILYNYGLLAGLNTVWKDVLRTKMIHVYINPATLAIGAITGIIISFLSVYIVTVRKLKKPVAELIKGNRQQAIGNKEKAPGNRQQAIVSRFGLFNLSIKNAFRNKWRSIAVIVLLAIGIFTIIITGVNSKTAASFQQPASSKSGTGGYDYWVETTIPVPFNLNSKTTTNSHLSSPYSLLPTSSYLQFHSLEGDDASCLNLNLVKNPRILGINPKEFDKRGAFTFVKLSDEINKQHPWLFLNSKFKIQNSKFIKVFPAYADETVIKYNLKKEIGDTLFYMNEYGDRIGFKLMGGLDNSIFQGNLLISDSIFMLNFPSVSGSKIMLVEIPGNKTNSLSEIVNRKSYIVNSFEDYGVEISSTTDRLNEFNSVENAYLSVFMVLGGLGILISTLGLGIVILRNMLERKQELALLLALGFGKAQVFKLVIYEYMFLLITGFAIGIVTGVLGTLPSFLSPSTHINITILLILFIAIFLNGLIWIYLPVRNSMKGRLIDALRNE